MRMKAIITGAFQLTEEEKQILTEIGLDITIHQWEKDEVTNPQEYDVALCNGLFLYNPIEKFTNLKYIQLASAGMDRVPMDYVKEHQIEIHNAGDVYAIPMAEWVLMRILEIYKNAGHFYKAQAERSWNKNRNMLELAGKKACIVGTGNVGCEIAKRLQAFDVIVIGLNRSGKQVCYYDRCFKIDEWKTVISDADFVILALPLTKDTESMVDDTWFSEMKPGVVFVNVARGKIVDEQVLETAIRNGKIMAAALDVFADEPLDEDHSFWNYENILISPHNSFVGENNHKRLFELTRKNLERAF